MVIGCARREKAFGESPDIIAIATQNVIGPIFLSHAGDDSVWVNYTYLKAMENGDLLSTKFGCVQATLSRRSGSHQKGCGSTFARCL